MKRFIFSCLLGLALMVGDVRADMRDGRGGGPPPQQGAAPGREMPATVGQNPRPEPVRQSPGVVHTQPAVRERPSGIVNNPLGALNRPIRMVRPAPEISSRQNFVGGSREFRRFRPDGDSRQIDFHHHGHRSNFVVVYVNGVACWYPFYTAYPYYYDAPLAQTYDGGYYDSGTSTVPYVDEGAGGGAVQTAPTYGDLGHQWGQDLRREVATWDDFVGYVGAYIIGAAPEAQAGFREAFIASYGINGAAAYDKAAEQAAQSSAPGPKIINMQPAY